MIFEKAKKQIQVVQGDITGTASAWHSVLPASGRRYTSLRKLFAPVADCCVFLCENGGVIYKDEQCIAKNPMSRALAEEIANDLWTRITRHAQRMYCGSF